MTLLVDTSVWSLAFRRDRSALIGRHQARIARDVSGQNRGKTLFKAGLIHLPDPSGR